MKRITFVSTIAVIAIVCLVVIVVGGDDCDECYSWPAMAGRFLVCGLVIIVGSIYFRTKFLKTESIIFSIEGEPLRETNEAVDGVPFAGDGVIEAKDEKTLTSVYSNTPCVYFHSIREQYVKEGKSGRWKIIENTALFLPFYLKDKKGVLEIDLANMDYDFSGYKMPLAHEHVHYPANSEIDCETVFSKKTGTLTKKGFLGFSASTRYRESEFVLKPGANVFVYGMVSKKDGQLAVREDERCPLIISKKRRDQYVEDFYKGEKLVYFTHFLVAVGYTIVLFSINYFLKIEQNFLFAILTIGNFVILGSVLFSLYNRIIVLCQRALNALSNIEVDLKRRSDLIPNLVEAIKGYSLYEKEVQSIIAEARARIIFSKNIPMGDKPIISSLVAVVESYPNLKASDNFRQLMDTLVDTEGRIAYSRDFYNKSVRKHNTLISQVPFLLVSWPLGIKEMEFITIARGENLEINE